MTKLGWLILENIAILATGAFLCWYFESGWGALLFSTLNQWSSKELLKEEKCNSCHCDRATNTPH